MRSWRSAALLAIGLAAGCGTDASSGDDDGGPTPDQCATSFLDYDNFGAPFVADWCRGCHSSALPAAMRQNAPADVNFDDYAKTMEWRERILVRATGDAPTMPPVGGPSDEERALLAEWLGCGGKQ
ncbi:MAG TPA: hypothetical protein VFQ53_29975 [Kofleriaceae bacterium]|nr:hypothetical protein [Kofleriaceae bacterium]